MNTISFLVVLPVLRTYAVKGDLLAPNRGVVLRPWMLTWKPDAGFKGYAEPAMYSEHCELHFLSSGNLL